MNEMLRVTTALALATVRTVHAWGNAIIKNECDFAVFLRATDANRNAPETIEPKSQWGESFHTPLAGGVSLKLATTDSNMAVTQFEYTLDLTQSKIWYDGSNIDCSGSSCPFYAYGLDLRTSDASCPARQCPVNQVCTGFYNVYNDDINSLSCNYNADIILTLCSVVQGPISFPNVAFAIETAPRSVERESGAVQSNDVPVTVLVPERSTMSHTATNSAVISTVITMYSKNARQDDLHSIVPTRVSRVDPSD